MEESSSLRFEAKRIVSLRSFASVEARRPWYELPLHEMSKSEREGMNGDEKVSNL
jgi:hypothetical protein